MPVFRKSVCAAAALGFMAAASTAQAFWSGPCFSFGPGGMGFHMPFTGFGAGLRFGGIHGPGAYYPPPPGALHPLMSMPLTIPPEPPRQPRSQASRPGG